MTKDIVNQKLENVLNRLETIDGGKPIPWFNLKDACDYTTLSRIKIRRACMAGDMGLFCFSVSPINHSTEKRSNQFLR